MLIKLKKYVVDVIIFLIHRAVMKNLMVGFLTVPKGQQKEVLKVIATVLDFNKEERDKVRGHFTHFVPNFTRPYFSKGLFRQ